MRLLWIIRCQYTVYLRRERESEEEACFSVFRGYCFEFINKRAFRFIREGWKYFIKFDKSFLIGQLINGNASNNS